MAVVENVSAFSPASDVILTAGMVTRLAEVLRYARQSVRVVRLSFLISAVYNVVGVAIAASGQLVAGGVRDFDAVEFGDGGGVRVRGGDLVGAQKLAERRPPARRRFQRDRRATPGRRSALQSDGGSA